MDLNKKLEILDDQDKKLLNKRSEIISHCRDQTLVPKRFAIYYTIYLPYISLLYIMQLLYCLLMVLSTLLVKNLIVLQMLSTHELNYCFLLFCFSL